MNILVTGGTGFIGSHLLHRLITQKHNISLIKRAESNMWRVVDIQNKIKIFSISSMNDLYKIFIDNPFDVIFHLSTAYFKHEESRDDNEKMDDVNIKFPSLLLELAEQFNVKSFINTGTCFEYKLLKRPLKESDPLKPYNYYASTKIAFDRILQEYVRNNIINAVTLRLFYPYGEKDNEKLIVLLCRTLLTGKPITITKGTQKINFTYVADIIDAYINTLSYITSLDNKHYESFNIGNDKQITIREVVNILENISKKPGFISLTESIPENEITYMAADISKAKKLLKWHPKTSIKDGLKKMYIYYLKNVI